MNQPDAFDSYCIVGLPKQFTEFVVRSPNDGSAFLYPTFVTVTKLEEEPREEGGQVPPPIFRGKVDLSQSELASIKGMSGGPIAGVRFHPQLRYWIVAIQASWRADTGIVTGTSLPFLAESIQYALDRSSVES
jgi:hypothetical protein